MHSPDRLRSRCSAWLLAGLAAALLAASASARSLPGALGQVDVSPRGERPGDIPPPLPEFETPEEVPEIVEPSQPPPEDVPEDTTAPEQVASARDPEPPPPAPPPISVSINATPWATIEIDGEEVGVTPMAGVLLAPGDHEFRARMPDGTVLEEVVRIAPDNRHIAFAP